MFLMQKKRNKDKDKKFYKIILKKNNKVKKLLYEKVKMD